MIYDAVVVGGRCAGAIVAGKLARGGWKVALVDKARFPSDTVSTHMMFPNTVARLESLGILERLHDRHQIPYLYLKWRILGYELAGAYTPIDGHSLGMSVRRIALDNVLVDWAKDGGAVSRFGERVVALIGAGQDDDPLRGVVLESGEQVQARWVIGADGRASTVAGLLGLEETKPMAGDVAFLMAYWKGLPPAEVGTLDIDFDTALMRTPCEDGVDLVSVTGPPEITRGSKTDREREYAHRVKAFPETFDAALLDRAERISDLVVVPERMMRGFFRQANGPGWALVGDAGHFKHPGTAQGISDAVEQAIHVADSLLGEDPDLVRFEQWRRDRSRGYYSWSFVYGSWPTPGIGEAYLSGLSSDPVATQDWLDTFTRTKAPSDVNTPERLGRWLSAPADA